MKKDTVQIKDLSLDELSCDLSEVALKVRALRNNPFADSGKTLGRIAGFYEGQEIGGEYVFPLLLKTPHGEFSVLGGSTLHVDPAYRRTGFGMDLPELRWQKSPSKVALGAALSQMALPVHQLLDYIVFLLPRSIMLWRSRVLVEMRLKGGLAKAVSVVADCGIWVYSVLLGVVSKIALHGYRIEDVKATDEKSLEDVAALIAEDVAQYSEVHDVRWLKWHMKESFSDDGPARMAVVRRKGNVVGFFMIKKRFHAQASHRGFRNVWLGSVIEWQMKKGFEKKLAWLLVRAALKLKKEGMDAVEIPSADSSLHRFFRRIGWRQVGESNFVIKAGEGSSLFSDAEMTKIDNWRLRPAMGDSGLS